MPISCNLPFSDETPDVRESGGGGEREGGRGGAHHLQPLLHGGSSLEVLLGNGNVFVLLLLTEVNHVRGKQRLAVLLEVSLVFIEHAIQPRKQLLGTVVGVQDDGNSVCGSNAANVVCSGNGTVD